jgi:hypothetical protein
MQHRSKDDRQEFEIQDKKKLKPPIQQKPPLNPVSNRQNYQKNILDKKPDNFQYPYNVVLPKIESSPSQRSRLSQEPLNNYQSKGI